MLVVNLSMASLIREVMSAQVQAFHEDIPGRQTLLANQNAMPSPTHMAESGSSGHDGGLVNGHGIFCVIRHNGVAWLMVGCDLLVLLINVHTPALRTFSIHRETRVPTLKNFKILIIHITVVLVYSVYVLLGIPTWKIRPPTPEKISVLENERDPDQTGVLTIYIRMSL